MNRHSNEIYERKLRKLKRTIKNLTFENAALCDLVSEIQENILVVKEERKLLLRKLLLHEGTSELKLKEETSTKPKIKKTKVHAPISLKKISYPFQVDDEFTVYNLGEIVMEPTIYQTENCIYPKNYVVSRSFINLNNPNEKCGYTLRIVENHGFPQFEVIPDNYHDQVIAGPSTDYCHTELLQQIYKNHDTKSRLIIKPAGDEFFGLTNNKIRSLINQLPNADKLLKMKQNIKRENLLIDDHSSSMNYSSYSFPVGFQEEVKTEVPDEIFM